MTKKKSKRVPITTQSYCPSGQMCIDYVKLYNECNHLPFKDMMIIDVDEDWAYVRCNERVSK